MGRNFSDDLAIMDSLSLETQIGIHLSSNCYPPIPQFMVSVAVEAINNYNDENGNAIISLPAGVQFRNPHENNQLTNWATASQLVNKLHLESWCNDRWEN